MLSDTKGRAFAHIVGQGNPTGGWSKGTDWSWSKGTDRELVTKATELGGTGSERRRLRRVLELEE